MDMMDPKNIETFDKIKTANSSYSEYAATIVSSIVNNLQGITNYCEKNGTLPGYKNLENLAKSISLIIKESPQDIHLSARLLRDLLAGLDKLEPSYLQKNFNLPPLLLKRGLNLYIKEKERSPLKERKTIKEIISFLGELSSKNKKFNYTTGKYNNKLLEIYTGLSNGVQKELKEEIVPDLENGRDRLESLFNTYRQTLLYSELSEEQKTNFLLQEFLDQHHEKLVATQIKELLGGSLYMLENISLKFLKEMEQQKLILENKITTLKNIRDYYLGLKHTPRTKDDRLVWPARLGELRNTTATSIYKMIKFSISANRNFYSSVPKETAENYKTLQGITTLLTKMIPLGYNIQSIVSYIEKEVSLASSKEQLKQTLEAYFIGLYKIVNPAAQAKAS